MPELIEYEMDLVHRTNPHGEAIGVELVTGLPVSDTLAVRYRVAPRDWVIDHLSARSCLVRLRFEEDIMKVARQLADFERHGVLPPEFRNAKTHKLAHCVPWPIQHWIIAVQEQECWLPFPEEDLGRLAHFTKLYMKETQ